MSDVASVDPIEGMLCRWAEDQFKLADVAEVRFEPTTHGPYSEVTPDLDPYIEVSVKTANGKWHYYDEWKYDTDLIRSILRFSIQAAQ